MTYEVFARAYRPQRFEDVVGQEHVTRTLTRSFENDRLGHAYIFSGPRGIGKTTTARLLAKLVNCESPDGAEPCDECESCERITRSQSVDVMEIDGASNNSVDQVRELRENVQYAPANNEKKVYIIDEVHMLSKSAFNALLKTLEEPPDHVIFIFATTEIENVPDTILSRCQRYDFRLIPVEQLVDSLREICEREDIPVEDEALFLIARFAEGSLRDAQSILDQMINFTGAGEETLTEERVSETWGLAPYDELLEYLEAMRDQKPQVAVEQLHEHVSQGHDLTSLVADLTEMVRNLTLLRTDSDADYLEKTVPDDVLDRLRSLVDHFRGTELNWTFEQLIELHDQLRDNSRFQLQLAEVGLVRIIEGRPKYNLSEIIDRLESLEEGSAPEPSPDVQSTVQSADEPEEKDPGGTESDTAEDEGTRSSDGDRPTLSSPDDDKTSTAPADSNSDTTASTREATTAETDESPDMSDTVETIVERTGQPAQAYLRESRAIERSGDRIRVTFGPRWSNHAEKLQREDCLEQFREAIRDVTDEKLEPTIKVADEGTDSAPDTGSSSRHEEPESSGTDQPEDDSDRLLEQTMDVFDVENVEKIDDS
jgi:DNA polymerase-3 subunit gamma/tau